MNIFSSALGAGIVFLWLLMLRVGQHSPCSCQPEPRHCPLLTLVHARPEAATAGRGGRDATLPTRVLLKHAVFDFLHIKGLFCRLAVICSSRQLSVNQSLGAWLDRAAQIWISNLRLQGQLQRDFSAGFLKIKSQAKKCSLVLQKLPFAKALRAFWQTLHNFTQNIIYFSVLPNFKINFCSTDPLMSVWAW